MDRVRTRSGRYGKRVMDVDRNIIGRRLLLSIHLQPSGRAKTHACLVYPLLVNEGEAQSLQGTTCGVELTTAKPYPRRPQAPCKRTPCIP